MSGAQTVDPRVQQLAEELGWSGELDEVAVAALTALLDDEAEQLDQNARDLLAERFPQSDEQVLVCPSCALPVLSRYQPDEVRCRRCATALVGRQAEQARKRRAEAAQQDWGYTARLLDGFPTEASWIVLNRLAPDRPLALAADNEDWDAMLGRVQRERDEAEQAKRRAIEEAARKKREAEEAARRAAEEAERKKREAEEAKRKAAEEAERQRREAEEAKRRAAEEAERQRRAAEEAERRAAEEAERKKREAEEAKRKAAEEAERQRRAAAEAAERARREAAEAAERARREAEEAAERARLDAAEAEERARREANRPTLGGIMGSCAGQVIRVETLRERPVQKLGEPSVVWLDQADTPFLEVAPGGFERINGKKVSGNVQLKLGDMLSLGEDIFIIDEARDLAEVSAPDVYFERKDDKPGGPWGYYNEEVVLGAGLDCKVRLVDDGVADRHARVYTHFGRIILEDLSKDDGLYVGGKKMKWLLLRPDVSFRLGQDGPEVVVKAGQAPLQSKGKAARAMKPTRDDRTVLDVYDADGQLLRRVFMFCRREIRFGKAEVDPVRARRLNDLVLLPSPVEDCNMSNNQGGLSLIRGGVELQRWRDGEASMTFDEEPLDKGQTRALSRRFSLLIGNGMAFEGRVYRSPSDVVVEGAPRLGMGGGHPFECVRLERIYTNHTYVFLVRMLRIGSEDNAPLRLELPGVRPNHAQIQLVDGRYQIVAPRGDVEVELPGGERVELEAGVPAGLQLNAKVHVGSAALVFRKASSEDFVVKG